MKGIIINISEVQQTPSKMTARRPTARHNIIKISKTKTKERVLKVARVATYHMQGININIISLFLIRNFEGQEAVGQHIKMLKQTNNNNKTNTHTINQESSIWQNLEPRNQDIPT